MFVFRTEENHEASTGDIKGGSFQSVHKESFPALEGMAIHRLSMEPGTLNPPHWHPNSHEIVYIISGTALFGIRGIGEDNTNNIFKATSGDVVFIEQNYLHFFKSIGDENLEVGVWFNSDDPTTIGMNSSLRGIPDSEIAQAFEVSKSEVLGFSTNTTNLLAGEVDEEEVNGFNDDSPFKYNIFNDEAISFPEGGAACVPDPAGEIRKATSKVFPKIKDFTLAHISLRPGAMRQIHWHRFANELNLVTKGRADFGIITPQDESSIYRVRPGDIIMAPLGYTHYALNTGKDDFEFVLGFDNIEIAGIDIRQTLDFMQPSSIRAQTLKVDADRFNDFKTGPASLVPPPASPQRG